MSFFSKVMVGACIEKLRANEGCIKLDVHALDIACMRGSSDLGGPTEKLVACSSGITSTKERPPCFCHELLSTAKLLVLSANTSSATRGHTGDHYKDSSEAAVPSMALQKNPVATAGKKNPSGEPVLLAHRMAIEMEACCREPVLCH
eukprot:CAMPEP_0169092254 /NCGR_PEP_ID=MMETSP1015-20121227/16806_1 /TAXON_ID=342587 /ORGANISM="Karlodinium micrum, Strain CCMP2283" /LENGTH=146 /DNA_ID=CAMNT_0009152817 /DNA_START=230 /DNA_END=671 /DNA_ORIENTATION=-